MIKLTYTEEMKEQDNLWNEGNEDFNIMARLYNEIIEEAKTKGFNGYACIYDGGQEKLCTIYKNEEEQELAKLGKVEVEDVGYCKPLIHKLENILNQ